MKLERLDVPKTNHCIYEHDHKRITIFILNILINKHHTNNKLLTDFS